jgi:hypothetical protein
MFISIFDFNKVRTAIESLIPDAGWNRHLNEAGTAFES